MKFGYFCNSTNWNNQKKYTQILEEIREISVYCDQNNWDSFGLLNIILAMKEWKYVQTH